MVSCYTYTRGVYMNKHGNLIWSCALLFYIVICFLGALLLINDGVSDVDAFLFFFMYFFIFIVA